MSAPELRAQGDKLRKAAEVSGTKAKVGLAAGTIRKHFGNLQHFLKHLKGHGFEIENWTFEGLRPRGRIVFGSAAKIVPWHARCSPGSGLGRDHMETRKLSNLKLSMEHHFRFRYANRQAARQDRASEWLRSLPHQRLGRAT